MEKRDALPPPGKPQGSKDHVPGASRIVQDLRQPVDELEIADAPTRRLIDSGLHVPHRVLCTPCTLCVRRALTSGHVLDVPPYRSVAQPCQPHVSCRFAHASGPVTAPFFVLPKGPLRPTPFGYFFSWPESSLIQDPSQSELQESHAMPVAAR